MTTYTAIANSEIDTDSPVTESLMTRIRDNPIAITEGASGAPKIQLAAMDTDSVGSAQIATNAVGSSEIAANAVGSSELATASANGNYAFGSAGNYILPAGWYLIAGAANAYLQVQVSTGWASMDAIGQGGLVFSDGTNTRIVANAATTVYWRKLS